MHTHSRSHAIDPVPQGTAALHHGGYGVPIVAPIDRAPNAAMSSKPSDTHGMTVQERVALARVEVAAFGMRLEVGGPRARFSLEGVERFVTDPRFRCRAILYGRILEEFRGTAFALVNAV
jgi:hypothetical protein